MRAHEKYSLYAYDFLMRRAREVASYECDFVYFPGQAAPGTEAIHEDVKSRPTRTPLYRLKRKLFEANYGIRITEVE